MLVDESVYSFKKIQKRSESIALTSKLAPLNETNIMKAMLTQMGKPIIFSATPSHQMLQNHDQSTMEL